MPKLVDRARRRDELLDAAIGAIAEHGLDGVTLMDVARAMDVTTGTIGYYFRDKDELLVAALHHLATRLTDGSGSAVTHFVGTLGLSLPLDDDARTFWRVWLAYCGAAPSSPTLMSAYRDFYTDIEGRIAAHLDAAGADRPTELAGAVVAAVDGIGLCATVAPDLWPETRQIATIDLLLMPHLPR